MSKFAALAADVAKPFRVELLDPATGDPILDAEGNPAWIDVLSTDSAEARRMDSAERRRVTERALGGKNVDVPDQFEINIGTAAKLTRAWHLVDPASGEVLDVPCTPENALELYSEPGTGWLFAQVWAGAARTANFMKRSARS